MKKFYFILLAVFFSCTVAKSQNISDLLKYKTNDLSILNNVVSLDHANSEVKITDVYIMEGLLISHLVSNDKFFCYDLLAISNAFMFIWEEPKTPTQTIWSTFSSNNDMLRKIKQCMSNPPLDKKMTAHFTRVTMCEYVVFWAKILEQPDTLISRELKTLIKESFQVTDSESIKLIYDNVMLSVSKAIKIQNYRTQYYVAPLANF